MFVLCAELLLQTTMTILRKGQNSGGDIFNISCVDFFAGNLIPFSPLEKTYFNLLNCHTFPINLMIGFHQPAISVQNAPGGKGVRRVQQQSRDYLVTELQPQLGSGLLGMPRGRYGPCFLNPHPETEAPLKGRHSFFGDFVFFGTKWSCYCALL